MQYRPEIDGLRAIAVVSVILYHFQISIFGVQPFKGGFIGVDIFFVISGYLITNILLKDFENKSFSLLNFYNRRARRILPALIFLLIVLIPISWFVLTPNLMKNFSQSIISVIFFFSNILFWRETGYFQLAANNKPLLHTWSLSVEEQFYIFFPVFLWCLWKFCKNKSLYILVTLAFLSFIISEWGWRYSPTANFYLAPSRAWELSIGVICSLFLKNRKIFGSNFFSILGFLMISLSFLLFSYKTPFPSFYTLLPTFGTALLIIYTDKKTILYKFLNLSPFYFLGLMSYSLYLWHWPLLSYLNIFFKNSSLILYLITFIFLFFISFISWQFIEKPFRSNKFNNKKFTYIILSTSLVILTFSFFALYTNGFENRNHMKKFKDLKLDYEMFEYFDCNQASIQMASNKEACNINNDISSGIIFGDSHAYDKFHGLSLSLPEYNWQLYGNGCPPLKVSTLVLDDGTICTETLNDIFNNIRMRDDIKFAILSFAHFHPLPDRINADNEEKDSFKNNMIILSEKENKSSQIIDVIDKFYLGLENTIDFLIRKNIKVILINDLPEIEFLPIECLKGWVSCIIDKKEILKRQKAHRKYLHILASKNNDIYVFDTLDFICLDNENCSIINNGKTLYRDSNHLSNYGSEIFGNKFKLWFEKNFIKHH